MAVGEGPDDTDCGNDLAPGSTESTSLLANPSAEETFKALASAASLTDTDTERSVHFGDKLSSSGNGNRKENRWLRSFLSFRWTESLRVEAGRDNGETIYPAAFHLRDAILGHTDSWDSLGDERTTLVSTYNPYSNKNHPMLNKISIACRLILGHKIMRILLDVVVWTLVLLAMVEPPFWCRSGSLEDVGERCQELLAMRGPPAFSASGDGIDDDGQNVQYYPNAGSTVLTLTQSLSIEWACVSFLFLFIALQVGRDGMSVLRFLGPGTGRSVQIVRNTQLGALLFLTVGMVSSKFFGSIRSVSLCLRIIIFVTFSKKSQREFVTVARMTPEVLSILFLLLIIILFYAWIGVVLFYNFFEGKSHFADLIEAMWTLWICFTTANYPDVMMPAYNSSRLTALYFVSFMIVAFFFFGNVILASIVNAYDNETEQRFELRKKAMEKNLRHAFHILDENNTGRIDRDTIMALFLVLNEDFPDIRRIPPDNAKLLFAILDRDGTNFISEEEFMNFGNVLLLEFVSTSAYTTFVEHHFPNIYESDGFRKFRNGVQSERFDNLIDFVLVLNAIVVGIQSYPLLVGEPSEENPMTFDGQIDTVWEAIETLFTVLYCLEMSVKLLVLGWKRYFESYRNTFDGAITLLALFATCYVYYPNDFSDSRLIRYVVMARVLRLSRLLVAMKPFQIIGKTFVDILPAATRVIILLFCIMYAFSALGVHLFGGMITRDPQNPLSFRLKDTDFADDEYWANNFNDMLSAMNVLFNLLVVNNWTTAADGILAVTESKFSRFFFLGFHVVGVIVVNNLVVAFIVDSFISEWDKHNEGRHQSIDTGEALITEEAHALFDAAEITGTKTELSGGYIAKLRGSAHIASRKSTVIRNLFTKHSSDDASSISKGNVAA